VARVGVFFSPSADGDGGEGVEGLTSSLLNDFCI
jgi:hypothetical protein